MLRNRMNRSVQSEHAPGVHGEFDLRFRSTTMQNRCLDTGTEIRAKWKRAVRKSRGIGNIGSFVEVAKGLGYNIEEAGE